MTGAPAGPLRILHLEDSEADAELVATHLEQQGVDCLLHRVENREGFMAALGSLELDLVIADFNLPGFSGMEALDLCRTLRPDLPFLLVSGTVGEEVAVECLKQGATDYFLKHRLQRLAPGIRRAVAEAEAHRGRELAQAAERRQAEEFRALADNIPDALLRFDGHRRIAYLNDSFTQACGFTEDEALGRTLDELGFPPACVRDMEAALDTVFLHRGSATLEFQSPAHADRYYEARLGPEFDFDGRVSSAVCVIRDTTEARRAESALEASEARYRQLFDQNPQPLWVYEPQGLRILAVNEAALRRYGYSRDEFLALTILDLRSSDDAKALLAGPPPSMDGFRFAGIHRHRTKAGEVIEVEVYAHDLRFEGQNATLIFPLDITERRRAELALQASERLHRSLVETLAEGVMVRDAEGVLIAANPRVTEILGLDLPSMLGRKALDPQLEVLDDQGRVLPPEAQPDAIALATGRPQRNVVIGVRRKDRRLVWLLVNCCPFQFAEDHNSGLVISFADITLQRAATEAVRLAAAERLELLEAAGIAKAVPWSEQANHQLHLGESAPAVLGLGDGHLPGAGYLLGMLEEEDRPLFLRAQAQARNGVPATFEARVRKGDHFIWTRWTIASDRGLLRGVVQDISEQHHLQDQLLQSQKLEILGNLVGGIAHDFNNLLMGILGHGQVLELDDLTEAQRRKVDAILQASTRGRTLVAQLMNFGRRKAETRAHTSLNQVVEEVVALLEHALPGAIEVRLDLDPDPPAVLMDANQIHQVVMNLAINARDALGTRGILTLRTGKENLHADDIQDALGSAGPHAFLEVTDNGSGIPEELQRRIFEPFFTTKEPGKGTGLGLSVVRRVVDDHRGLLRCRSVPGEGTTFRILLPLQGATVGQGIVGLLDDPGRDRAALQAFLESEGLTVLAADHWQALQACSVVIAHAEALIDGLEQAIELHAHAPDVKVLLASRQAHLGQGAHGLPFTQGPVLPFPYDPAGILQILQGAFA